MVTESGNTLDVKGIGTVAVTNNKAIPNVLYTQGVTKNLLSVGYITNLGNIVVFNSRGYWVYDKWHPSKPMLHAVWSPCNLLYWLYMK